MEFKQVIVVRADLKMGCGKISSQVAHASTEALEKTKARFPEWVQEWKEKGAEKVVLKINSEKELLELFEKTKKEIPSVLIKDAGKTQVKAGTSTCVGIGPCPENLVDKHTKQLKLL
jgi:PTH2 family peptidyl-tRNA hydrolase